jgi:uncharacterized coiled-coil protein SlyX
MPNDYKPFDWQAEVKNQMDVDERVWKEKYQAHRRDFEQTKGSGVYYPATSTTALSQQIDSAIAQLGVAIARQEKMIESVFQMMEALMKDMENYRKEITAYTNKMVRSCPQCDMIKEGIEFEEGDYICRSCREVRND